MRVAKRVVLMLLVLILTLMVVSFVLENQQGVALSFLGWSTMQMPVAVYVVTALIVGLIIGPLFGVLFSGGRRPGRASVARD